MPLTQLQADALLQSARNYISGMGGEDVSYHLQDESGHLSKTQAASLVANGTKHYCGYFQAMETKKEAKADAGGWTTVKSKKEMKASTVTGNEIDLNDVWLLRLLKGFFKQAAGVTATPDQAHEERTFMEGPIPDGFKGYTNSRQADENSYVAVTNMLVVVAGFAQYYIVTAYPIA